MSIDTLIAALLVVKALGADGSRQVYLPGAERPVYVHWYGCNGVLISSKPVEEAT